MSNRETAQDIEDAAAAWAIRLDEAGDDCAPPGLDAWLAEDRRRVGALLRAQAALSFLDRGRALAAPEYWVPRQRRVLGSLSRRQIIVGAAVTSVSAIGAFTLATISPRHSYKTLLGEVRQVPLEDGSIAAINTSSELSVALTRDMREVDLLQGEAWFKVAKDPKRPFVVSAGPVRVRAIGTAFSVRRQDAGADIVVTEGTVETWVVGAEDLKVPLPAGKKVFISDSQPASTITAGVDEINRSLAWRKGQIALSGETLSDAASQFNRYNARKIVVTDPLLASEKLVGEFRTDDPEAFANSVAVTLGAVVTKSGPTIRLSRSVKR